MTSFCLSLLISFFVVAFGQPGWFPEAGICAALFGYALFWKAMCFLSGRRARFFLSFFWFFGVHAIQLSWMTSTHYMGPLILFVYMGLLVGLGVQFGLLSLALQDPRSLSRLQSLGLAGAGVLLEWVRHYFLTGFTWNPAGLALAGGGHSIQLAACFGIYGLSFWVFWTNLEGLSFLFRPSLKQGAVWVGLAVFPYFFGLVYEPWVKGRYPAEMHYQAAVVDTGIKVEEKNWESRNPRAFIPPLRQWENVWSYLKKDRKVELIVLPEAAFPYGTEIPFCPLELAQEKWRDRFGEDSETDFPPLKAPYAYLCEWKGTSYWRVTNAFFAQALANHFQADVVTGFDCELGDGKRTNAALLFRNQAESYQRYDKRILAPVGEYIPLQQFQWVADFLAREFNIRESFAAGKEAVVFQGFVPIGVPICLEELYTGVVRELVKGGAKVLVGLSNDVWFPDSRLAKQHLEHARVRAVENGVYLIRSSNMGWTGAIDCFGQSVSLQSPGTKGAVYLSLPLISYPTLYSVWGNGPVLWVSALAFLAYAYTSICKTRKKKLPLNGSLG